MILTADAVVGGGCDSAVGGTSLQIRGESLVFGETEGEFRRERGLGLFFRQRSKYFRLHF